ncbi:MAG: RNA-binding domain-containing protein [Thermoprotei archaeon]
MRIKYVEVRALCHATEDEDKVKGALSFLTGTNKIVEEKLTGVYGEPIIMMKVKEQGKEAMAAYERLISDEKNRQKLIDDLDLRLEGWKLHVRLDKQDLVKGSICVGSGDNTVKVVVGAGGKTEKGREAKSFFLGSMGVKC